MTGRRCDSCGYSLELLGGVWCCPACEELAARDRGSVKARVRASLAEFRLRHGLPRGEAK